MKFTLPICTLLVCLAVMNTARCRAFPPNTPNAMDCQSQWGMGWPCIGIVQNGRQNSPSNPSAKWTNFTDGSCQRLIFDGDLENNARYLLGCDALDCCIESQEGNRWNTKSRTPILFDQGRIAGKHTISQYEGSKIVKVTRCLLLKFVWPHTTRLQRRSQRRTSLS